MIHDASQIAEAIRIHEELDRRQSRRSFLAYYMRMTAFDPPKHVKVICKLLQSMEDDKVDRAMIFAPPRHAKTLLASKLFPSWILGRNPGTAIMQVAHTDRFAQKLGGSVRNYLRDPRWPFDQVGISRDSSAKTAFTTRQGGEYNGFGMFGGNQHGNPAEWLLSDDIIKGRKIAMSPHMREEAWETYRTDLLSRLQGRAKQLIVFTRWHQDDPAGRILPDGFDGRTGWYRDRETKEPWFVLSLPAVAEHDDDPCQRKKGDWLWPEHFGESKLGGMRKRGGWVWSSLYQQRPSPQEGLLFKPDHIRRYSRSSLDPTQLQVYITSDYAVTAQGDAPDPDYTVHMVWGVDPDHNVYLLDMWRGRTEPDVWAEQLVRLCKKWKPLRIGEESGQIIKSVGPFLRQMMQRENVYVSRVQLTSSVDKQQRAYSLLGMASEGKMYLPQRADLDRETFMHVDAFETELLQFPTGRHDDCVDAATLFGRMLDRIIAGRRQERGAESPHGETLDELWLRHEQRRGR